MSFLVSPGVEVKEIDITNVIPAVSTSIGAFVGNFAWGPVNEITPISSEKELASVFGKPDTASSVSFFTAASFLKYGSALKVIRRVSPTAYNATSSGSGERVDKESDLATCLEVDFVARHPGVLGNSIRVVILTSETTLSDSQDDDITAYAALFDNLNLYRGDSQNDSQYGSVDSQAGLGNLVHALVIDDDGKISGVAGTVLEKYQYLSLADPTYKKSDGSTGYFYEVINTQSSYIWTNVSASNFLDLSSGGANALLANGLDGADDADLSDYSEFADAETVDINLVIGGQCDLTKAAALLELADNRKDVVVFVSPETNKTVNITPITALANVVGFFNSINSSSYAVFDSTAVYIYDKYNDKYLWIPASGHMAGLCARTDRDSEPWFSPAGYNRGNLLGVTRIAFNPDQAARNTLYKARINPIVSFPGQGILLYGDKTAQSKPSAFDRINVRRLFIILEKAIATSAKYQLFELNDEFTRATFRNMVEPFLRDIRGRRGITDFLVVCDETNNTGEVIDTNRFVADIYIKPARSINFITLNFIATRTGVAFSEIVGL